MTQLVLIVIIAAFLLLIVGRLLGDALRKRGSTRDDFAAMEMGEALRPVQVPPVMLMDRIFAQDDLTFVSSEGLKPIRRQFLQDRRRLALSWLELTRLEAVRILRLHLRAVRTHMSLQPLVELQLLSHTLLFFLVYTVLWAIFATNGAFWARGFVRNVVTLTGRLSSLGARILADADRSGLRLTRSHGHA